MPRPGNGTDRLTDGEPLRFGRDGSKAVIRDPATCTLRIAENVPDGDPSVVTHDAHLDDPSYAFALSRLATDALRYTPMGVLRDIDHPWGSGQLFAATNTAMSSASVAALVRLALISPVVAVCSSTAAAMVAV